MTVTPDDVEQAKRDLSFDDKIKKLIRRRYPKETKGMSDAELRKFIEDQIDSIVREELSDD